MASNGGTVCPFSQFRTVQGLTPSRTATCFWVSLSSSRRFLTCWPRVQGSKSVSFGFNALSLMGTNCKRATRPCKCGYLGHHSGRCHCTPDQVARYRAKISGPLLDRIDLHVEVPALPEADLVSAQHGESSKAVRERVEGARRMQLRRQGFPNALLTGRGIEERARIDAEGRGLLRDALSRLGLSARAHHRVLKIARTIADLQLRSEVRSQDVAEALRYRGISASR